MRNLQNQINRIRWWTSFFCARPQFDISPHPLKGLKLKIWHRYYILSKTILKHENIILNIYFSGIIPLVEGHKCNNGLPLVCVIYRIFSLETRWRKWERSSCAISQFALICVLSCRKLIKVAANANIGGKSKFPFLLTSELILYTHILFRDFIRLIC